MRRGKENEIIYGLCGCSGVKCNVRLKLIATIHIGIEQKSREKKCRKGYVYINCDNEKYKRCAIGNEFGME